MAPLLGRQDSVIILEWHAKVQHGPTLCKFEHTNGQNLTADFFFWCSPNFGQKNGLNLSEDLFFLASSNFGSKTGLNLSREFFLLVFKILKFPGPLLSKILRTLVALYVMYVTSFIFRYCWRLEKSVHYCAIRIDRSKIQRCYERHRHPFHL